jgi:hypothetical protein
MESNTNSVVESKLIIIQSKVTTNQRRYLSHVRFKGYFKEGGGYILRGSVLLSAEIPCSFYNINVNDATLY